MLVTPLSQGMLILIGHVLHRRQSSESHNKLMFNDLKK